MNVLGQIKCASGTKSRTWVQQKVTGDTDIFGRINPQPKISQPRTQNLPSKSKVLIGDGICIHSNGYPHKIRKDKISAKNIISVLRTVFGNKVSSDSLCITADQLIELHKTSRVCTIAVISRIGNELQISN